MDLVKAEILDKLSIEEQELVRYEMYLLYHKNMENFILLTQDNSVFSNNPITGEIKLIRYNIDNLKMEPTNIPESVFLHIQYHIGKIR